MARYRRKRRRRLRKSVFIKRIVQLACLVAVVFAIVHLISAITGDKGADNTLSTPVQSVASGAGEENAIPEAAAVQQEPAATEVPPAQTEVQPARSEIPQETVARETAAQEAAPQESAVQDATVQDTGAQDAVSGQNRSDRHPYGELPASAPVDDSYFDDAVFVGDSVMHGFYYDTEYKRRSDSEYFGDARFLTATSYALYHAVSDRKDVAHPSYRGKVQPVEISIRDMGAKKVYIMLGMNDVFVMGVMKSLDNYETLLADIRSESPDVEIYILSVIPCTRNAINKNSKMDKDAIAFFNKRLPDFCAEHNCYYIDVASNYLDEDGYLRSEYSSDDYVHIQSGCYGFWADALRTHTAIIQ